MKTKYSIKKLQEFKKLIEQKLLKEKESYQETMDEFRSDEGEKLKLYESGAETYLKEEQGQRVYRQATLINQLQEALVRIEKGTYGKCLKTNQLIPEARLKAIPQTTTSI